MEIKAKSISKKIWRINSKRWRNIFHPVNLFPFLPTQTLAQTLAQMGHPFFRCHYDYLTNIGKAGFALKTKGSSGICSAHHMPSVLWGKKLNVKLAAIAQWFCLRLPSCGPGFKSRAHHLCLFQFVFLELWWEKDENKRKRGRDWPVFKKKLDVKAKG